VLSAAPLGLPDTRPTSDSPHLARTGAASVYGWRTVLSGTLLPSRPIGTAFPDIARRARKEGHETGVHAWDHRQWQDRLLRFPKEKTADQLDRGFRAYCEGECQSDETQDASSPTNHSLLLVRGTLRLSPARFSRGWNSRCTSRR
jgi:hypothetical protein